MSIKFNDTPTSDRCKSQVFCLHFFFKQYVSQVVKDVSFPFLSLAQYSDMLDDSRCLQMISYKFSIQMVQLPQCFTVVSS